MTAPRLSDVCELLECEGCSFHVQRCSIIGLEVTTVSRPRLPEGRNASEHKFSKLIVNATQYGNWAEK